MLFMVRSQTFESPLQHHEPFHASPNLQSGISLITVPDEDYYEIGR